MIFYKSFHLGKYSRFRKWWARSLIFFSLRGRVDEQSRRFHQITFAHEAVFLGVNLATIFHGSQNCEERMNQKKREEIRGAKALFISVRWLGW